MRSITEQINGLTDKQAAEKLSNEGANELASAGPKSFGRIALDVLKEPMVILLVSCGTLYLILGSVSESMSLIAGIILVIGITLYQERKTEKALEALKKLATPKATVIRDGIKKKIPGREVVTGDVIVIDEGNNIPADALLLQSSHMMVNESILTGESLPVKKEPHRADQLSPEAEPASMLYSGTMVVNGAGIARVLATGINTELGKIGQSLKTIQDEKTPLQVEMSRLVRIMAISGIALCLLLVLVYYITKGNFIDGLLAGLALAMAMLPEEFPIVFTIFMALGAWRMSKWKVLVRKPSSIEALGTITVLCTDKTGTITQNKMQVSKLYAGKEYHPVNYDPAAEIPEAFHELVEYSILASRNDPFDPMEKSIHKLGELKLAGTEHIHTDWQMVREYPLSADLLAMSMVYTQKGLAGNTVAAKGAPEAIFTLCKLPIEEQKEISAVVRRMASHGLRVLAVAKAQATALPLPHVQQDFDFVFCGLIGLSDPVRAEIPQAVKDCHTAGIRVILITGDYPVTAQNIAAEAGIHNPDEVITGKELELMSGPLLAEKIKTVNVFARIKPEQKLLIVNALKGNGEIVAMTGDGVNDAPALKAAHVGISMGEKGTDVARAASSLVLLDDNFASIVSAIKMGRRIFDNLQKAFSYILSIHIPIAGLALIPAIIPGLPVLLWPIHIAFHELVIDPISSVVFEQEGDEHNIMNRPPRKKGKKFFSNRKIAYSIIQGAIALGIVLNIYFTGLYYHLPERSLRAATFTSLVLINLALALSNLSKYRSVIVIVRHPNTAVKWILSAVCLILVLILTIPGIRNVFMFQTFSFSYLLFILTGTFVGTVLFELMKYVYYRKR